MQQQSAPWGLLMTGLFVVFRNAPRDDAMSCMPPRASSANHNNRLFDDVDVRAEYSASITQAYHASSIQHPASVSAHEVQIH